MKYNEPYIIEFKKIGSKDIGFISIAEYKSSISFSINRVFWTYGTPNDVIRGKHAHRVTEQVLIAVCGVIKVKTILASGKESTFILDNPSKGVYIPPHAWHTMTYSEGAVQLVLASTSYTSDDYIRDYEGFLEYWKIENTEE